MRILAILLSFVSLTSFANPFTIYTSKNGMINSHVNCIEKGENFIWIGTNRGINRIVFEGNKPVKFSPRGTSVPVTALEDDGKVIWVGLKGKGVYMMPKENYKFIGFRKDVLGDQEVERIEKIEGGLKVFTPNKEYLFKFDSKTYQEKGLKIKPGIWTGFDIAGKKLFKDKDGVLKRYNEPTKSSRFYEQNIKPKSFLMFNNGVLLASSTGLVFYDPSKDDIVFGDPKMSLSNFQLNGEDTITDQLDLNWDEYVFRYNFEFEELGNREDVTLNYSLTGPEGEVIDSANGAKGIELKGLTHGDYKIAITAVNKKGIKSVNSLDYKFSIANPLKDSIWQYIIIGAIAGFWTVVVVFLTRSKFKKDIRVLEDALLEKTNKLNQIEKGKYGLVEEDKVDL